MTGKLVLGVDAGGDSTRAVLVRDGAVVSRHSSGPMNILLHADALDRLVAMVNEAKAEAVGLGLPGLRNAMQAMRVTGDIRQRTGASVVAADDATIALLGAFAGGPGIVVIAGTGSVAVGWPGKGRVTRLGGHGFLLGDEGGGYWIGRAAISAALRGRDGVGPANSLGPLVETTCATRLDDLVVRVHSDLSDRKLISRVAAVLASTADPVGTAILAEAADHLVAMAMALRSRLGDLPVSMVGSVFGIPAVRDRFVAATGSQPPVEPPELGAVRLALGDRDVRDAALVT
jgi:glucosamine kinase